MKSHVFLLKSVLALIICLFMALSTSVSSQTPTVTVRFAHPFYDCLNDQYCVDVEFQSDLDSVELFGMNVRFFYDDNILELVGFGDFQGGYGPVSPNPPTVATNGPAGPALFNFGGPAEFINGAIQLVDNMQPAIYISTTGWTKIFQICFTIDDPNANVNSFCPPIVWDLEQNPANGGFLTGDDGVVITIVDPDPFIESAPAIENVVQFNWMYTGNGTPPYGQPVEQVCTSLDCSPVIVCAADIIIECDESTLPDFTGYASATDICAGDTVITYSDVTVGGLCPQELTITRTWIVTNDCNLSDTCVQTIMVVDTTAPIITCPPNLTLECTSSTSPDSTGVATAIDNCDSIPTVTFTDTIVGGSCPQEYILTRTWVATDDCGNSSSCAQTIEIIDTTPPLITCPGNITIECTASTAPANTGTATATDNCDTLLLITSSDVTVAGGCPQEYTITRTWTAADDCGNTSTCAQTIFVDDSTAPGITCPANITIQCTESTAPANTGTATASDNCDGTPTVTFTDVVTPGSCPQESTIARTWSATDDCGNTSTCLQTITVDDSMAPTITCPANITIECTASTAPANTGSATASDNCDGTPTITFTDVVTPGSCPQESTIARTWSATDDCGNTSTCLQTITVDDSMAPTITCPANITIECTASTAPANTGSATASDNCDVTPTITFTDVVTPGSCPQESSIARTWSATDDCGNTSTCLQIITVDDSLPPTITCPVNITIECTASTAPANTGTATATDNCDGTPTVTFSDVITAGSCLQESFIARTWIATDDCGNTSTCIQIVTVDDSVPPSITCPANVTVSCANQVPAVNTGSVTTSDNCGGVVTVTHVGDVISNQTCANRFTVTRTYNATDACGNSATCAQIITVNDQTPPTLTCPANVTVSCASQVPAVNTSSLIVNENCGGIVTVIHLGDVITNQTCVNRFTITRTYQASDLCGNSTTCAQIITVNDQTPPVLTCPVNVTVSCASQIPAVNTGSVTTSDNCGGVVTVTHVGDVITNQTCANRLTVTRTYLATDACGNSASCAQIITVNDQTPPIITCPADVTIDFGDSTAPANTGNPTGSDNCGGSPSFTFNDVTVAGICEQEFTINRTWIATDACGNTASCLQVVSVVGQCNVDLSLIKELGIGEGPILPGDDITFTITVTNEGETDISAVTIIDYIPIGFVLNDPDWTAGTAGSTGQSATITLSIANGGLDPNGLNPGESVSVNITLLSLPDIEPGEYFNIAEILTVIDINGNDVTDIDIDSDPDDVDTNDPEDEDDHDPVAICVLPQPVITGDHYVCPEEIVTYSVEGLNPNFTYVWTLSGGGQIVADNGSSIDIQWQEEPGGPFQVTVQVIIGPGCSATAFFFVYIQGVETLVCNDHVQISIDEDCESVVLSGVILEGENEGNDNYFVVITDQNGNVIPNATLTYEHVGQTFMVSVQNECNNQSCWGTISVEDKLPPDITCSDAVVPCGTPLEPVYSLPITGSVSQSVNSGLPIGPNLGAVTTQLIDLVAPANALITDVNVTVDLSHTWSGDILAELISPSGTSIVLANAVCGAADNWNNVTFDDQALTPVVAACNVAPPPALLQGFVIPEESLSIFNGEFADGAWTLQITDLADFDAGTLNSVSLNVQYVESLPYAPEASDACGTVTLSYTETETGETCDNITITRVWTATDGSGNTATCTQTITILPLDLDDVIFPINYLGECGEEVTPDFTGWPTLNGQEITDENELCNIFLGYWDKELTECGGGRKILRTWTVLDWCTVELIEGQQIIKLTDTEGPELTCPPDLVVGTDFWYCYANVSVPKPVAYDICSEIASYELASTGGTIVSFGNNFVINGLELGTYTVTWTVTDECGNSTTCSFDITVEDDVVPVANCDQHTIVSLTNDGPHGITLVPATVFDDGSYDNCGPVTFRARRMDSCIDFDWTTEGACIDDIPGGIPPVNSRDRGTVHRPCVPFACCDVGAGPVMVELEVTDAAGNVNYCMIEATVQDKISPFVQCPPDIIVSCDFWFNVQEGTYNDGEGNNDGTLDEDPLSPIFGNMYDAFRYDESVRGNIIINDPGNHGYGQPHNWGIEGWAADNCEVSLQVRVRVIDDCTGGELPANAPSGAVKLIERRFSANDGNEGSAPGTCTQRIWVVDYDPFYITDETCNNSNPNDGVIWPCDILLTTCPDDLSGSGEPQIFDDACSLIGVTYEDTRFDFVDGACFKILREWAVIDWCQYNAQTGDGLWHYTQVIKVHDEDGPAFVDCPSGPVALCVADEGVTLPDNNQAFLGEGNPLASSCSVHLNLTKTVHEACSDWVQFDVKIYPFNGTEYILIKPTTTTPVDENNNAVLSFNTRESSIPSIRNNGLPYNSPWCGDYHRILWSVEDGCGNWSHCEYLFRLEDCKQPSPVCINGLSTVVMPIGGQVTIWAKDFDASSFDDCTPADELLYSFSGDAYEPSFTYTCDNVPAFGVELTEEIWVADGGTDDNCNGKIEWSERNKDYCTTTIVITDNNNVCGGSGSILAGEVLTDQTQTVEKVNVTLTAPGHFFPTYVTATNGIYAFSNVPFGQDYTVTPERNDNPKNGVSTLDLVRIQKHLLGKELFTSPYQYIAADANNNQQVSAIDLVEIRKLILGLYLEFPENKSWRFVEKGFQMAPDHPWPFNEHIVLPGLAEDSMMHNDFIAVKIGDVNHTAKANATQIQPRGGARTLNVQASASKEVSAGEIVELHLTIPERVNGFQWTLETDGLTYAGISSEVIQIGDQHVGLVGSGIVTMSWNGDPQTEGTQQEPVTFVVRFKAITSGRVSDMIRMNSSVTTAEAYTVNDDILDVRLSWTDEQDASDFALYQNKPNPWNEQTSIGFELPEDGKATLTVFDATGKEILKIEGEYKAGYNVISLGKKDFANNGVMYYRLDSGEYSASKKMVMIR